MHKTQGPKVALIGAGGMSFGPVVCNDAVKTQMMRGGLLMMHDINEKKLNDVYSVATRLNENKGNPIRIEKTTDPARALDGADFCLMSTEIGRFRFWQMDYEIPLKYGSTHINGENGGPGAVFHSLRSIKTCLSICENIQKYCPETFLINLTNPMSRVTLAINRGTKIRNAGLCHEFAGSIARIGLYLNIPQSKIIAKAAGINHFTFYYDIHHKDSGEDLIPSLKKAFASPMFDYPKVVTSISKALAEIPIVDLVVEQMYSPLVAHMFRKYGIFPVSVDSHIGEYVPYAQDVTKEWHMIPWKFHKDLCGNVDKLVKLYGSGKLPLPVNLLPQSGEEAFKIIKGLYTDEQVYLNAVNVPNRGYIPNLPEEAIVEVPAWTGKDSIEPETAPPVHEHLAEFMRTQIDIQNKVVDSALNGDPELAFEALKMDPQSPADENKCRLMFNELRGRQAEHLPF